MPDLVKVVCRAPATPWLGHMLFTFHWRGSPTQRGADSNAMMTVDILLFFVRKIQRPTTPRYTSRGDVMWGPHRVLGHYFVCALRTSTTMPCVATDYLHTKLMRVSLREPCSIGGGKNRVRAWTLGPTWHPLTGARLGSRRGRGKERCPGEPCSGGRQARRATPNQ